MLSKIKEAIEYINSKTQIKPETGIILGTGLGALVNECEIIDSINYQDIPHFPISTVESHTGRLIFGFINKKPVVIMQGRFHYYEGYNMQEVTFPVRVFKFLGIPTNPFSIMKNAPNFPRLLPVASTLPSKSVRISTRVSF